MVIRKSRLRGFFLWLSRRQADQQINVVRLDGGLVGRAVAADLAAFLALVNDDIALARVRLDAHGAQDAAACVLAVARLDIHVQGTKATRAMVARAISERQNGKAAVAADKAVVIFSKAFCFQQWVILS